jgi:nicotinamide phosphoribosyltransferase
MFLVPSELNSDSYKQFHHLMYPKGMEYLYSNMTPRSYKRLGCDKSVFFGLQYYIKEYLIGQWNSEFFNKPFSIIEARYKRFHKYFSGIPDINTDHLRKLHQLGYLPLTIKALEEGTLVPARVPYFTIRNTVPGFGWLVNFLESNISNVLWDYSVNATIAYMYRKLLNKHAEETGDPGFVQWQGHDFSMRGRASVEGTFCNGGHLLSFTGTDTIPAVLAMEEYYNANMENELIGMSVPATEHSIMTSYGKENEVVAFERVLDQFPTGIISIVSDSFDLWKVCTEYVKTLNGTIINRDGKLVIRPDSGDPVDILCGKNTNPDYQYDPHGIHTSGPQGKGVVELLWDSFSGTANEKGYKVLDSHIGVIYGDSITLDRANQICERLRAKGFASTNVVLGIGSYTYNYNTRDTLGMAIKSTHCIVDGVEREIFKDPITDDGLKKSAKGLLRVDNIDGELVLKDQCTREEEMGGELTEVFTNGKLVRETSLSKVRQRLWG